MVKDADRPTRVRLVRSTAPLGLAVLVFVALATWLALIKAPWCDEGSFANPAYDLAFRGHMGISVLEPSGHYLNAYLSGVRERTYIVPPNHLVLLAGWFKIFGFSLLSMREYSIVWGALGLGCLFYILRRLFADRRVAALGTLLTAIDFIYLWSSADGRMESSANAMALAAIAGYLHFRERGFGKAVLVSQVCGAAAVFTHPNALLVILILPVLGWRYADWKQLRLQHLFLAAAPCALFGGLWLIYILQSPADFHAQFFANAAGRNSSRWKTIIQPWLALSGEGIRHFGTYLTSGLWSGEMSQRMVIVPMLYMAALLSFIRNRRTHIFLASTVTLLFGMTFLNGFKAPNYLIYIVPFYDAALAFWLLNLWAGRVEAKAAAVAIGLAFVALQLSASIEHIRVDEYHRDYQPAIAMLQRDREQGKTIVGTAALGFGMGFAGFTDDWRLGTYSHFEPDVLVMDRSYRYFTAQFENDEPLVFSHVVSTLSSNYRLTYRSGSFWIFERDPGRAHVDIQQLGLKEKGKQAEYLFKQLLANAELEPKKESAPHAAAAVRF